MSIQDTQRIAALEGKLEAMGAGFIELAHHVGELSDELKAIRALLADKQPPLSLKVKRG